MKDTNLSNRAEALMGDAVQRRLVAGVRLGVGGVITEIPALPCARACSYCREVTWRGYT